MDLVGAGELVVLGGEGGDDEAGAGPGEQDGEAPSSRAAVHMKLGLRG